MQAHQTIFVTGATGNQGGAVTRHLLQNGFQVKALTRDPSSRKAAWLKDSGAEVIKGDLADINSFSNHLQGVSGVFSVQPYQIGRKKETILGINLAEQSVKFKVPHFVYSSVFNCDLGTGIPHWESKNDIENYIRQSGLSYTILRPASLYENLLIPAVKSRILKGKYVTPLSGTTPQQYVSSDDIGRITTIILKEPSKYKNQVLPLAFEELTGEELAALIEKTTGRKMKYEKLPGIITRIFMGKDLHKMFNWVEKSKTAFIPGIEAVKKQFPGYLTWAEWIGMKIA